MTTTTPATMTVTVMATSAPVARPVSLSVFESAAGWPVEFTSIQTQRHTETDEDRHKHTVLLVYGNFGIWNLSRLSFEQT